MPIIADIVPYVFIIENEQVREALKSALVDYFVGKLTADNTLDIQWTNSFTEGWKDDGSGANMDLNIRRPTPLDGYSIVGHSTQQYISWPVVKELTPSTDVFSLVTNYNSPLLRNPTDYERTYADFGSGADLDGSFWTPICSTNYRPLGFVDQIGYDKPTTDKIKCVHDRCIVQCAVGTLLWNDQGSGGEQDVAIWSVLENEEGMEMKTGIAIQGYDTPSISGFNCLKKKCIAQPFTVTDEVRSDLRGYFTVKPPDVPDSGENSGSSLAVGVLGLLVLFFI